MLGTGDKERKMRKIRQGLIIVCLAAVVGVLLLLLTCFIPASRMYDNCLESYPIFEMESLYYSDPIFGRRLDNWSDSLMLLEAAYPGNEGKLDRAVNAYYNIIRDHNPCESFYLLYSGARSNTVKISYAWYWHGYLATLRPLFAHFDFSEIRNINTTVQIVLLLAVSYLFFKRYPSILIPFLLFIALLGPTAIAKSLHFSSVYYVLLIVLITMLSNPWGKIDRDNVWRVFLLSGILTAYLDLLSAPTLSLTVPLCLLCVQLRGERSWKENMKVVIICTFFWFFGYAGMWSLKWVIAGIFQGQEFLSAVRTQILFRLSATGNHKTAVSRTRTLYLNWSTLFSDPALWYITIAYAAILLFAIFHKWKSLTWRRLADTLVFAFPALIPLVWILLLCNHSRIHYWFSFRTLAPIVLSVLCALSSLAFPLPKKTESNAE